MISWFNKFEGIFVYLVLILIDVIYFSKKYQMSSLVHMNAKAYFFNKYFFRASIFFTEQLPGG